MKTKFYISIIIILHILIFIPKLSSQGLAKINNLYGSGEGKFFEGKNGVLYFYEDNCQDYYSKLFKSQNNGISWNSIFLGNKQISSFSVDQEGVLYIITNSEIHYSEDEGVTWEKTLSKPNFNITYSNIYSISNGIIIVYDKSNIYQSFDRGKTWQSIILNYNYKYIRSIYIDKRTNNLFLVTENQLIISKDLGKQWSNLILSEFGTFGNIDFIEGKNNKLYLSAQEYIWVFNINGQLLNKVDLIKNTTKQISLCQTKSGKLLAFELNQNFYSEDDGITWKELSKFDEQKYDNLFVSNSGIIFAKLHSFGSIHKSIDEGTNWEFSAYGINSPEVISLLGLSNGYLLIKTPDGYFINYNVGQNFEIFHHVNNIEYSPQSICNIDDNIYFFDTKFIYEYNLTLKKKRIIYTLNEPYTQNKLIANKISRSIFLFTKNSQLRSLDGGNSWQEFKLPLNEYIYHTLVFNNQIFISYLNSVYMSIDNGNSWLLVSSPSIKIRNLFSSETNVYFLESAADKRLFLNKSYDESRTWVKTKLNLPENFTELGQSVIANNIGDLYIIDNRDGKIYKSLDDGRSFNYFGQSPISVGNKFFKGDDHKLYYSHSCGIYSTLDPASNQILYKGNLFLSSNNDCDNFSQIAIYRNQLLKISNNSMTKYTYCNNAKSEFYFFQPKGEFKIQAVNLSKFENPCINTYNSSDLDPVIPIKLGIQELSKCPELTVDVAINRLRRCFESSIYLKYHNKGTEIASNALIEVKLDNYLIFKKASIIPSSINGNLVTFKLGDIDKKTGGEFTMEVEVSCMVALGQTHCVEAIIYPNKDCDISVPAKVKTSAQCIGDSVHCTLSNTSITPMSSTKNWKIIEYNANSSNIINSGSFQLNGTESKTISIPESQNELLFIAEQTDDYTYNKLSQTQIKPCNSGKGNIVLLDEEEPYYDIECLQNIGSYDPNDIIGLPNGITDARRIEKSQEIEYTIRFQNTGTDTAFNINIMNNLDNTGLDISTIEFGVSSHPYSFNIINTNTLLFTFRNIQLPDSNINSLGSNGFLRYKIKPNHNNPNDFKITNKADIYFDFNEAVATNIDFHTLGLPITSNNKNFESELKNPISVIPNPVNEILTIQILEALYHNKDVSVQILNTQGKEVWKGIISESKFTLDCSEFMAGVYCITTKSKSGKIYSQSFIKY